MGLWDITLLCWHLTVSLSGSGLYTLTENSWCSGVRDQAPEFELKWTLVLPASPEVLLWNGFNILVTECIVEKEQRAGSWAAALEASRVGSVLRAVYCGALCVDGGGCFDVQHSFVDGV